MDFLDVLADMRYMEEQLQGKKVERDKGQRRFVRVVKYGHVWEEKVLELINDGVSDKEIAARLNADVRKIRGVRDNRGNGERVKETKTIETLDGSIDFIVKRQKYRNKWLQIVRENPGKGRVELRRLGKYACTWLCRNDREWWEKNTPKKKYVQADNTIDWETKDKEILQRVKQTVQEILESDKKPQRISLRLIKIRSGLKSFDIQLDKLPLTKSFINSVLETPLDLHKRRIQWAIDKLNKEGKALTVSNITAMTGVGNKYRKQVVEEIKSGEFPSLNRKYEISPLCRELCGGEENINNLLSLLRRFCEEIGYMNFFDIVKKYYRDSVEAVKRHLNKYPFVLVMEDFYGKKQNSYHYIITNLSHGSFGICFKNNDKLDMFAVMALMSISDNEEENELYRGALSTNTIIHEFAHPLINPLTEKFGELVEKYCQAYEWLKK
ncbi:MAG: TnsD family Tn7-like transposition protein [Caldicoprobacterales bacterium]